MAYRYIDDGYPESDDYSDNYEWYNAAGSSISSAEAGGRGRTLRRRGISLGTGRRLANLVCRFGRGMARRLSFAA